MRGIRNKVTLGTLLVGVLLTAFSFVALTPKAHAAPEYKWIDSSTIRGTALIIGNTTATFDFVDSQPTDTNFEFTILNTVSTCKKPKIVVDGNDRGRATLFSYQTVGGGIVPPSCVETPAVIAIGDVQNSTKGIEPTGDSDYRQVTYNWVNKDTIKATGTLTADFVKNGELYFRTNDPTAGPGCRDSIKLGELPVLGSIPIAGTLTISDPVRNTCNTSTRGVVIGNPAAGPAAGTTSKEDAETACTLAVGTSIGGKGVGWVVCAMNDAVAGAVSIMDDLINSNLQPDLTIFDKAGNGSSYHSAWNSFRVIALGFVVIAALIMVIAQAMGLDIFDAYTVRKVLPRLLAAAVFITISWDVLEVFYRLSDAATIGLRSLIYAPFSSLDAIQLGGGSAFSATLLGGGALIALGWIALLSFGLSALIAVALAFFILVLIKVALAGVLIASPIFIAASILPGTSKLYEFGKGALISLLLAPVVVGALIALFRVGAVIAYNRQDGNAAINQIIAILLYFGAYGAMLKGLSAVGGFAATITGFVNDRGKGLSDGLKKYRSNTRKQRGQKMASGSLFEGKNILTRHAAQGFNWASRHAAQVPQAGLGVLPGSRRKHKGLDDIRSRAAGDRVMKSEAFQQLQYDDDASAALFLSGGKSASRARDSLRALNPTWDEQRIKNAVSTAQAIGITRENAIAAGTLVAKNKARSMGSGQALIDAVHSTSQMIGGRGSTTAKNIEEGIQYHLRTNGRTDAGAGTVAESWGRSSMGELNNSAPAAMNVHLGSISSRIRTGSAEDRRQAAVQLIEAHNILSQGTNADSQQAINDNLTAMGYDLNQRGSVPIEDFAARLAGIGGPGAGKALRTQARAWDPQQHPGFRPVPTAGAGAGTGGGAGGGGSTGAAGGTP